MLELLYRIPVLFDRTILPSGIGARNFSTLRSLLRLQILRLLVSPDRNFRNLGSRRGKSLTYKFRFLLKIYVHAQHPEEPPMQILYQSLFQMAGLEALP